MDENPYKSPGSKSEPQAPAVRKTSYRPALWFIFAGVGSLVQLLTKEFVAMVIVAILIATPIGWYAMNKWLQDYNYRISMSWVTFVFAGVLAVSIALLTVSFQAIKAALANPVKSLRSE